MIFKKPYAFFIKYFRLINFILAILASVFFYKLSLLHNVINQIYLGKYSNFSNLSSEYIGFSMYLLLFIIFIILFIIILLLKSKNKPFKDYLFLVVYNIIVIIYLFAVNNMFFVLVDSVVEQTKLDLYSDISLLIFLPLLYFIIKYILIAIGFNLKKFDFSKDIIELKAEDSDSEEVELIFDKNSYKYKRSIRKSFREFRYYILENKFFVIIICFVIGLIGVSAIMGIKIFDDNKVYINKSFVSKSISYTVNSVYETKYDLHNNEIKEDFKYVIASINVKNISSESSTINFKDIRIVYDDKYVYANNYFNNYFNDLGKPYNNEYLNSGESYNYLFIFQVPSAYKSNKYEIKFYSGIAYEEDDINGVYKTLSIKAKELDSKLVQKNFELGDNTIFDKEKYKMSNITIRDYKIENTYINRSDGETTIIKPNNINNVLLILEYELSIDENSVLSKFFNNSNEFFNKFLNLEYIYNGNKKTLKNIKIINSNISNKLFVSIPYEVKNAEEITVKLKFRNLQINYKIK